MSDGATDCARKHEQDTKYNREQFIKTSINMEEAIITETIIQLHNRIHRITELQKELQGL